MNKKLFFSCLVLIFVFFQSNAVMGENSFEYNNGLVSYQGYDVPIMDILDNLSEAADLQIIIIRADDMNRRVNVNFIKEPVEDVIRNILKGYSYAIVFNVMDECEISLFHAKGNEISGIKKNIVLTDNSIQKDEIEDRKYELIQMIEELNQRIESGISDKEYEKWAKIRGQKYVTHDRVLLEHYQQILGEL